MHVPILFKLVVDVSEMWLLITRVDKSFEILHGVGNVLYVIVYISASLLLSPGGRLLKSSVRTDGKATNSGQ